MFLQKNKSSTNFSQTLDHAKNTLYTSSDIFFNFILMLGITDLKVGTNIILDSEPYVVTWNQHSKQARGGGVMKTKLKNLITGSALDRTFQGSDKIEPADIGFRRAQFLYEQNGDYEFMDQETYETVVLQKDILGDSLSFLIDGMTVDLLYFGSRPINIQLPPKMILTVAQTDPGVQGDRAQGGTKPATLETGFVIRVPLFIESGEKIVVNTDSGEYVERAK